MRLLTLRGDHREMGLQHGRQLFDLRPLIVEAMDRRLAHLKDEAATDLLEELEQAWTEHARSTLDMLAGIAEALHLDLARLLGYAAASYLADRLQAASRPEACTVWAASGPATADGSPILAKNRDYSLAHLPLQAVAVATPSEGYRYVYVTSAGSPAVFSSGMNEEGLAVADTHVSSPDLGPGLARYTLMMEMLERHTSVASALDYLGRVPRMGGGNLILADADGEMAVFEAGHRHVGVVSAENHVVVATNHFVTPALRGQHTGAGGGGTDDESEPRRRSVRRRLGESWGSLSGDRAREIMASHADGEAALCRHELRDDCGTISTAIFLPAERSLLFCNGRPCESDCIRYSI